MSHQTELRRLTIAGIAYRCAQETERFFRRQSYDPGYCLELFRRTVVHRNQRAWELIFAQYCPLVARWVQCHPAFPDSGEEVQYFINRAFEKMWIALTPDKFGHFSDLKSLLRYMKMCVDSAILDHVRTTKQPVVDFQVEASDTDNAVQGAVVEDSALARVRRQEFWEEVDARLRDEKERRVVYGSFVLALKPRELCTQFPETFCDVNQVYRIKENVLVRLRRDTELEIFCKDA